MAKPSEEKSRSQRWQNRQKSKVEEKSKEEENIDEYLTRQGNDIEGLTLDEKRQLFQVLKESEEAYSAEQRQRSVWEEHEKQLMEKTKAESSEVQMKTRKSLKCKRSKELNKQSGDIKDEICDRNIKRDREKENKETESGSSNRSSPEIIEISAKIAQEVTSTSKSKKKNRGIGTEPKENDCLKKNDNKNEPVENCEVDAEKLMSQFTNVSKSKNTISNNKSPNSSKSVGGLNVRKSVKKSCSDIQQHEEMNVSKKQNKLKVKKKTQKRNEKMLSIDFSSSEDDVLEELEKKREISNESKIEDNKAKGKSDNKHSLNKEYELKSLQQEKEAKGKTLKEKSLSLCRVEETDDESDKSAIFGAKPDDISSVTEVPETMEQEGGMDLDEDETQDLSKCSPDIFETSPLDKKSAPSAIEIDSPEVDRLLTPGQSMRESESVSILEEIPAENVSQGGDTKTVDPKGEDTQAFEISDEKENMRTEVVRKRSREDEQLPKKAKKQKVIFDFMLPEEHKNTRTPSPKLQLKSRFKQWATEKKPYFAPPGVDPCKYTETVISYLTQYENDVTNAQRCVFPCMQWPSPIRATYPFPKKEEKESRKTPLSELGGETTEEKESTASGWKKVRVNDSQHFKPIGRATRSKKITEDNEELPDLDEETQDYEIEEVAIVKPIACKGKYSGDVRKVLSKKDDNIVESGKTHFDPGKRNKKKSDENGEESQSLMCTTKQSKQNMTQGNSPENTLEECKSKVKSKVSIEQKANRKSKTPEIDSDSNEGIFVLSGQATMEEDYVVESVENELKVETPTKRFFKSRHKKKDNRNISPIEKKDKDYEPPGLFEDFPKSRPQTSKRGRGGRGRGRGKNISPTNTPSKRKTPVKFKRISPTPKKTKDNSDNEVAEISSEDEDPIPKNVKHKSRSPVILGKHASQTKEESSSSRRLSQEDQRLVKTVVDDLLHPQETHRIKRRKSETPSPIITKEIPGTQGPRKDAVICPLCGKLFPADTIQRHASDCGTEAPPTGERIVPTPRLSLDEHWQQQQTSSTPKKPLKPFGQRTPNLRLRRKTEETNEDFDIVEDDSDNDENWKPEDRKSKKRGAYHFPTESDSDEDIEIISKKPRKKSNSRPTTPVSKKRKKQTEKGNQNPSEERKIAKATSQCPVCQAIMFQDILERHVDECLRKQEAIEPKMLRPSRRLRDKQGTTKEMDEEDSFDENRPLNSRFNSLLALKKLRAERAGRDTFANLTSENEGKRKFCDMSDTSLFESGSDRISDSESELSGSDTNHEPVYSEPTTSVQTFRRISEITNSEIDFKNQFKKKDPMPRQMRGPKQPKKKRRKTRRKRKSTTKKKNAAARNKNEAKSKRASQGSIMNYMKK